MASEREYLVSIGLAKPGRGRFSAEAKQALAKARNDGMQFDQPVVSTPRVVKPRATKTDNKPTSRAPGVGVIDVRPRTLASDAKIYHTTASGKRIAVSDKNVCGSCGPSLSHHSCSNPTALVQGTLSFVPVTIE